MATCRALVLQLAYISNTRIPINRLPPEIFGHMLLFLKDHFKPFPGLNFHYTPSSRTPLGSWHRASLVCRHWRKEVLGTPGLWTTIKISDDLDITSKWTTRWQSRSGALPLTAVIDASLNPRPDGQVMVDVMRSLVEMYRVRALCVYSRATWEDLRPVLMEVSGHLETLYLIADGRTGSDMLGFEELCCELPRLQELSVIQGLNTQLRPSGELRHLSLACEPWKWGIEELRGFLDTLAANTRLEELMLQNVIIRRNAGDARWNAGTVFPERRWPLPMPMLKRLFVEDVVGEIDIHPIEDILSQTLLLPPTCTRFYVSGYVNIETGFGSAYPFERLVAASDRIVGTDGISACVFDYETNGGARIPLISRAEVRELWLQMPSEWIGYDPHGSGGVTDYEKSILDLQNVAKLVIEPQRDISFWLLALEDGFPALKELQILRQCHNDYQAILRFLTRRKHNGLQVDTLRLVGDPSSDTSEAYNSWKENPQEFCSQVNRVVFEEVSLPATGSHFEKLVSTRLGLPEACKSSSPTSQLWQPWTSYVSFD